MAFGNKKSEEKKIEKIEQVDAPEAEAPDEKVYLLNNDSKRIITVNNVRLMVGLNRLTADQVAKLKASPYFEPYFNDEDRNKKDKLAWVRGFGPEDHRAKDILDLPFPEAKRIIKDVLDIEFLKDLEIACKDSKLKDFILEQMKSVLPSDKELK